jgi:hypothetical protein
VLYLRYRSEASSTTEGFWNLPDGHVVCCPCLIDEGGEGADRPAPSVPKLRDVESAAGETLEPPCWLCRLIPAVNAYASQTKLAPLLDPSTCAEVNNFGWACGNSSEDHVPQHIPHTCPTSTWSLTPVFTFCTGTPNRALPSPQRGPDWLERDGPAPLLACCSQAPMSGRSPPSLSSRPRGGLTGAAGDDAMSVQIEGAPSLPRSRPS